MKMYDLGKMDSYDGAGPEDATHDETMGSRKRHPKTGRKGHSESELGRIEADRKRKRKPDTKANVYY